MFFILRVVDTHLPTTVYHIPVLVYGIRYMVYGISVYDRYAGKAPTVVPHGTAFRAGFTTHTSPPSHATASFKSLLISCLHALSSSCRLAVAAAPASQKNTSPPSRQTATLSDRYRLRIAQKTIGDAVSSALHRVLETAPLQCGKFPLTELLHAAALISSVSSSH